MLMKAGRIGTLIFWMIVAAALIGLLPGGLNALMKNLGILVGLAHLAEVGLMYTILSDRIKATPKDALMVMIYGAFYLKPKLDATRA